MLLFFVDIEQLNDVDTEQNFDALDQNCTNGASNIENLLLLLITYYYKTDCDQDQVSISQLDPNILTALGENTEKAPNSAKNPRQFIASLDDHSSKRYEEG